MKAAGKHVLNRVLACVLTVGILVIAPAIATAETVVMFVPDNIIRENRDGRQLIIKTYTLPPEEEPSALVEEPFEQEGFLYGFISIVKEENPFESRKTHSETVTLETSTDDLAAILEALSPTLPYDDGEYDGVLALDHTSLHTEATGYSTKSYTISETKTIGSLDRNDPSYVPKTTVKNGRTLNLSNIEWSVQGTSLADDVLVPTQFMAIATYRGSASQKVANGYITTATYSGEIISAGIAAITYMVTYLGEPVTPISIPGHFPWRITTATAILMLAIIALVWFLTRKNIRIYTQAGNGEYELIGSCRITARKPYIDLRGLEHYPATEAVIEIEGKTARRLFGRLLKICLRDGVRTHLVEHSGKDNYWVTISTAEEGAE